MNIILAENSGFCFGVKRAVELVEKLILESNGRSYTLGELIHNPQYLDKLKHMGVVIISEDELSLLAKEKDNITIVIRTHGIKKEMYERLSELDFNFIDATCPYVKKIHKIVAENSGPDTDTIIIGDRNHPEVEGICSYAKGPVYIFSNAEEIMENYYESENFSNNKAILVSQTTYNTENYKNCQNIIKKLYTNLIIFDTICRVTENRQTEARSLATRADLMLVLGGKQSSNAKKLFEICSESCPNTIFAETADDLKFDKIFKNFKNNKDSHGNITVGITAGASTPDDIIEEVKIRMTNELEINSDVNAHIEEKPEIKEGMSFEEMLNASYRTIRTGERVQGVITSVSAAEIHVDLGIKHTGIIPYSEVSDDPSVDIEKEFKPGDTIDVIAVKFNDAEGTVQLSKKRIDNDKNWKALVEAEANGTVLTGKIVEAVNRGVIFQSGSNRVFIPGSQTNISRGKEPVSESELAKLVGTPAKIKIIDVDSHKKRAVGSIRLAEREIRKEAQDKFWETVQVGQKFTGKVKSLTQYGAFVDLGGVDGMVHITELSWKRIKHPSEVVSVGDTVDVYAKSLDPEKKRISLGLKTEDTNPWNIFTSKYKEGDVAEVKIVSLMPFGAFAEIVPGVDGLIHISQISDRKIQKPADELKIGDIVKVKITAVDAEAQKVSLSIRALIEPSETVEAEDQAAKTEE